MDRSAPVEAIASLNSASKLPSEVSGMVSPDDEEEGEEEGGEENERRPRAEWEEKEEKEREENNSADFPAADSHSARHNGGCAEQERTRRPLRL